MHSDVGSACRYIRRLVAARVSLRRAPEIRILYDHASERGDRVLALLDQIQADKEAIAMAGAITESISDDSANAELKGTKSVEVNGADAEDKNSGQSEYNVFMEGVGDPRYDSDTEGEHEMPALSLMPEAEEAEEEGEERKGRRRKRRSSMGHSYQPAGQAWGKPSAERWRRKDRRV
jgi:hypothetical protein